MTLDVSKYKAFLDDAERDDRLGHQTMIVTSVEDSEWPSGDKFKRVRGTLQGSGSKVDFNLNPLPTDEEMAQSGSWERRKKAGIAAGIRLLEKLDKLYQKDADTITAGDEIGVNVVKNKEGFLRVAAIIPAQASNGAKKSETPF